MCTFGTRTSTNCKNRQLAEPSNENQPSVIDCKKRQLTEPDENQAPVSDSAAWQASTRVFWSHTIEGQCVAFDGVPFIVSATKKNNIANLANTITKSGLQLQDEHVFKALTK